MQEPTESDTRDEYESRMMGHYKTCLERRMRLWFSEPAAVSKIGGYRLEVSYQGLRSLIELEPRMCSWRLFLDELCLTGSFDKVTKRLRQILSRI